MDKDRIVEIGARALAKESTDVLWDQMTAGQKAAEIARSEREFRAALAAFEEAGLVVEQGWQPMETAPRVEREPLLLGRDFGEGVKCVTLGWWLSGEPDGPQSMGFDAGFEGYDGNDFVPARSFGNPKYQHEGCQPTHWRPLPAPPAAKADPQ